MSVAPDMLPVATVTEESQIYRMTIPSVDDHIGKQLLTTGSFYEGELLKALRRLVSPGDVIVDVGANIGNHTVYFAGVLQCKVIAIEPLPLLADILRFNVARNNLSNSVTVHQLALGAAEGLADIEVFDESNYGGTTLRVGECGDIEVAQLDILLSETVGLIKIDAEGMDYQVLLGARKVIEDNMPIVVIEAMTDEAINEIEGFLTPLGYSIVGQYNATPTYILLPMRTTQQLRRAIGFLGLTTANQLVTQRSQEATIRQVSRYAERLSTETYARIMKEMGDGESSGSRKTAGSATEQKTLALQRRLARLETTIESERTAFRRLAARYKEIASHAQRFEKNLDTRSQRMTAWRNLETAARASDLDNLASAFLERSGRPIEYAVEILEELGSENNALKDSIEAADKNYEQLDGQLRELTVSRGQYARLNKRLNKQLADMTVTLEVLTAENAKLRIEAKKLQWFPSKGKRFFRAVIRKIKKQIVFGGEGLG